MGMKISLFPNESSLFFFSERHMEINLENLSIKLQKKKKEKEDFA
jgi:hypothetical protein